MEVRRFEELSPEKKMLVLGAVLVRDRAYAPYSGFKVGAALLAEGCREVFTGCNVEGVAHDTVHAENGAISAMVNFVGGNPRPYIRIIAVALEAIGDLHAAPCGGCRQRILEFNKSTIVLGARLTAEGVVRDVEEWSLGELIQFCFGPENLGR